MHLIKSKRTYMKKQTKYSILVIVFAALVLEIATAEQFFSARRVFTEQLMQKAQRDLNESPRIANVKQEVETVVDQAWAEFGNHLTDSAAMLRHMVTLCESKPQIVGIALAFIPEKTPQAYRSSREFTKNNRFSFFVYRDEEKEKTKISLLDFDYTTRHWFQLAIQDTVSLEKGSWSEPYIGVLNNLLMSSYTRAITDSNGQVIGAVCADVPLRELSQMAAQLYDNQKKALLRESLFHILGIFLLGFIIYKAVSSLRRLQEVSAEKERIASELSVARNIQQAMLPKAFPGKPERQDLELFASIQPAREVGGDFYDFIIRKDRLYFCIGDVSGKGVPAALLMCGLMSHFRTEARRNDNATAIVTAVNHMLCSDQASGYFATMFVGVLDLITGQLDFCNAGHEAPIVKERGSGKTTPLEVVPNLPVGSLIDWNYVGQTTQLLPDTTVFMYTDGLSEASNPNGTLFSRERVMEILTQSTEVSPQAIIEKMAQTVSDYEGGCMRFDDITMLAFDWTAPENVIIHQQLNQPEKMNLCFAAKLDELLRLKSFVNSISERFGIDEDRTQQIRLVLEEAVSNVINYSEADSINIHACTDDSGVLVVTIKDNGKPFDPVAAPEANIDIPMEERQLGGLGIELMRSLSDSLEYMRENEYNILTIRKTIK